MVFNKSIFNSSIVGGVSNSNNSFIFILKTFANLDNNSGDGKFLTFKDLEIIIVDDGSQDNSYKIYEKFAENDKRIKIIKQKNNGLGHSRNVGIKAANGHFISFIDSDDWLDLDFYEKLHNSAVKNNSDIAVADFIREYPNKKIYRLGINTEKTYYSTEDKYDICKLYREGCVWNKIYNLQLVKEHKLFFEENIFYEDREFSAKALFYSNSIVTVKNTYYHYFVNKNSITRKIKTQKHKRDYIKVKQKVLHFIREKNINVSEKYYAETARISLGNIPLITVKETKQKKYICIFSYIPIFQIKI